MNIRAATQLRPTQGAFTLTEMLVAITILALLVVLVSRLTISATATVTSGGKHMDSDKAARLVFDRMAIDVSRMPKRADLDYSFQKQAGSDLIAFYCETAGFYGRNDNPPSYSKRSPLSLVGYRTLNFTNGSGQAVTRLQRLAAGLGWEPGGTSSDAYDSVVFLPMKIVGSPGLFPAAGDLYLPTTTSRIDFKNISEQVFRFEYCFLLKDGTLSINPWLAPHTSQTISDVVAVVVAIAVLDNTNRLVAGDLQKLADTFPDAADGQDIQATWNAVLTSSSFPPAGVTKSAALQARVYQRFLTLRN